MLSGDATGYANSADQYRTGQAGFGLNQCLEAKALAVRTPSLLVSRWGPFDGQVCLIGLIALLTGPRIVAHALFDEVLPGSGLFQLFKVRLPEPLACLLFSLKVQHRIIGIGLQCLAFVMQLLQALLNDLPLADRQALAELADRLLGLLSQLFPVQA